LNIQEKGTQEKNQNERSEQKKERTDVCIRNKKWSGDWIIRLLRRGTHKT